MNKGLIIKQVIIVAGCMLAIILFRLGMDQVQGYRMAIKSLEAGGRKNAIMYFDRVLNAHIPFSPLEEKAGEQLIKLGGRYEEKGDLELALLCYETVRTSRYLTAHFFVPGSKGLLFMNHKIASIKSALLFKEGLTGSLKEGYEQQMKALRRDISPSAVWSAISVIAFLAYLGAVILWILKQKRQYIFVSCILFVLWITALYLA